MEVYTGHDEKRLGITQLQVRATVSWIYKQEKCKVCRGNVGSGGSIAGTISLVVGETGTGGGKGDGRWA